MMKKACQRLTRSSSIYFIWSSTSSQRHSYVLFISLQRDRRFIRKVQQLPHPLQQELSTSYYIPPEYRPVNGYNHSLYTIWANAFALYALLFPRAKAKNIFAFALFRELNLRYCTHLHSREQKRRTFSHLHYSANWWAHILDDEWCAMIQWIWRSPDKSKWEV